MPITPDDVTADNLLSALSNVGRPVFFTHPDRETPVDDDIPALLGGLTAACEALILERSLNTPRAVTQICHGWIAGAGAHGDALVGIAVAGVKAGTLARVLEEMAGTGAVYDAIRESAKATALLLTAALTIGSAKARMGISRLDEIELKFMLNTAEESLRSTLQAMEKLRAKGLDYRKGG